ncbi:hypothetical protein [Kitasatospora sp. NE20-6]|uniref:hypothetical protein n=1 Tax=Kitasatospora sp. NE20-6 TaxID=2859066 RepID=UPI0038B3843A
MGPLPASIYWRRRVVVLSALAVVVVLVAWLVTGSGDGGAQGSKKGPQAAPVQSITPGAGPSGSAITSRPGGTGGGSTGGGTGSVSGSSGGDVSLTTGGTGSGSSGTDGTEGTTGTTGTTGDGSAAGGASGSTGTGGGGGQPPVNTSAVMALPVCKASQVSLELASELNAYTAKVRPRLALTVRNTSASDCRVDLGRTASTLTVTSSAGERVWSSGDCPSTRQATWVRLTAGAGLTENFTWDRSRSKPLCATAPTTAAEAGNYLVQADLTGPAGGPVSARTSVRLEG